jgi:DnaJ-class molecular chaperone
MNQKATHYMDDRKLVLTVKQREEMGSDYQYVYNIPCVKVRGKVRPLYVCERCNGTGIEPTAAPDSCDVCMGSGGLPHNAAHSIKEQA